MHAVYKARARQQNIRLTTLLTRQSPTFKVLYSDKNAIYFYNIEVLKCVYLWF